MNYYEIWCNLKDGRRDLEFVEAVRGYLGHLKEQGLVADFRVARRKLGFSPPGLGDFQITIMTQTLAQLDEAFGTVATRAEPVESLHARVFTLVEGISTALYRDFPDPQRRA